MKSAIWLTTTIFILALLPGCVEPTPRIAQSEIGPGIGPFDANGNYREDWADDPSKWRRPGSVARNDSPPVNANPLPPSAPTKATPPAPRPRPSVRRHTVKRGDTLSGIARRYGSSVSAIRKANGVSGHLIYPGQRLVVPSR